MFLINKCEKCAFFKAYKIVLKLFKKLKTLNKSFYWIIYDFINITTVLNKYKYISHVVYFETNFYIIYTHKNKKTTTKIFIRVIHIIKTKYKKKIMFVYIVLRFHELLILESLQTKNYSKKRIKINSTNSKTWSTSEQIEHNKYHCSTILDYKRTK